MNGGSVGAVVLNWNRAALTRRAAESLVEQVDRVYLVDNGSEPSDREQLCRVAVNLGCTVILNPTNLGYGGGNNAGIARGLRDGADLLFVMNNDAVAEPGAVPGLASRLCERPQVGAVSPIIVDLDGTRVLHTACRLDEGTGAVGWEDHGAPRAAIGETPRPTGYVTGAAFLTRRAVIQRCGLFNEAFFLYFEDTEWSLRARRAGYQLEVVPGAAVRHAWAASTGGPTATFYKARNELLLIRGPLGRSRGFAARETGARALKTAAALAYRRRPREAAAVAHGWVAGLAGEPSAFAPIAPEGRRSVASQV